MANKPQRRNPYDGKYAPDYLPPDPKPNDPADSLRSDTRAAVRGQISKKSQADKDKA